MENATILSEGVFATTYGKTANGLVRYSKRYHITSVIDSRLAGQDAGQVLMHKPSGIPIISSVEEAINGHAETLIVGIASDGGVLPENYRPYIRTALGYGMNIVSGLHDFVSDDPEFVKIARRTGSRITDVRKLFKDKKYFFTGNIEKVKAKKIAVLGTDSAIGKRTTAIYLNRAMKAIGKKSVMIGTGQTSWMQGFKYTVVVDAIVNDFVAGALETITYEAWDSERPDYMFIEGQGSVLHPAYPGSFEIIGATRPDAIILQHAPMRKYFDGFPGYEIPPLEKYIKILELLSNRKVIAIALNTENMDESMVKEEKSRLQAKFGIPVFDPLQRLSTVTREIDSYNI
ncbi:hypothetical protein [Thermoplasma volcanium GSS1]|uniref:DUF1611 domain-containing protein n=1 Tax=Thermoplasma volcanium (strain ATCC 51530 / DSM 4299 / JCM 9571 / NBRC 15438 / GSS1) TaxID=273116 RepID=Q97CN0_THEVO|nr:DUF1611 domain-containing protein [Thermoplasma volcanium]BAB59213.1 hypothetical protein [Thermoplasma volcanium GSS1]